VKENQTHRSGGGRAGSCQGPHGTVVLDADGDITPDLAVLIGLVVAVVAPIPAWFSPWCCWARPGPGT